MIKVATSEDVVRYRRDPFSDANIPNIRQSAFHVIQPLKSDFLVTLIDAFHNDPQQHPLGQPFPLSTRRDETTQLINLIVADPAAIDFIVTHVLTKERGALSAALEREVRKLLEDATMWDEMKRDGVIRNTPSPRQYLHVDTAPIPRELRVTFSPDLSTMISRGWYEHLEGFPPTVQNLVNENGKTLHNHTEVPDAGLLVLFESSSSVHSIPAFDQRVLNAMGGQRRFLSQTFSFENLVHQAQLNLMRASHELD